MHPAVTKWENMSEGKQWIVQEAYGLLNIIEEKEVVVPHDYGAVVFITILPRTEVRKVPSIFGTFHKSTRGVFWTEASLHDPRRPSPTESEGGLGIRSETRNSTSDRQ